MISILEKVLEAIETSRKATDFNISEDPGHLWIRGKFSYTTLQTWQSVVDEQCSWLELVCKDDSQDIIKPKDGEEGELHRIDLKFQSPDYDPHILTPEGWHSFLYNERQLSSVNTVRLAFINNAFELKAFSVIPWINEPTDIVSFSNDIKNNNGPRRQVRCQSSDLMAPLYIEPWILSEPAPGNKAIAVWQEVAAYMITKSLPNELYKDGEVFKVTLSGQPLRKLDLGTFQSQDVPFQTLQDAAIWVYLESEDVEVRHTFLTTELARAWKPDISFCDGLSSRLADALESARLIYKAHLRTTSKDTLKALGDLRKTLAEEVQKLLQQSKDLSSAVWRDVAIAIGAIAIRLSINSVKLPNISDSFAAIYLLIVVYIGVSYLITIKTNERFLKIIEKVRKTWRTKLYAFLDDNDYQSLADKPLNEAIKAYNDTAALTNKVVIVVICILMLGIAYEINWIEWNYLFSVIKGWKAQVYSLISNLYC